MRLLSGTRSAPAVAALVVIVTGGAHAAHLPTSGVLRVIADDPLGPIDPAVAWRPQLWQLQFATGLTLVAFKEAPPPDGWLLSPDGAAAFPKISNSGRTYTFRIRKGFRFSDGRPVTADAYAWAMNRLLSVSPALLAGLLVSPDGEGVVGAADVLHRTAKTARGIVVKGNRLIIHLTRPDPELLVKLALPPLQAIPTDLPLGKPVTDLGQSGIRSAGPFYVAAYDEETGMELRKNLFYTGKRHAGTNAISIRFGVEGPETLSEIERGAADYAFPHMLPADSYAELGSRLGTRHGRFRVNSTGCAFYLRLRGRTFSGRKMRRAISLVVDRSALIRRLALSSGAYSAGPTDQYIPPGFPGFKDAHVYPLRHPDAKAARRLVPATLRDVKVAYLGFGAAEAFRPEIERDLKRLRLRVVRRGEGVRVVATTFVRDECGGLSSDPMTFLVAAFGGQMPSRYRSRMVRLARLSRERRLRAIAHLDAEIARRSAAPSVPLFYTNTRELFSRRIDVSSIIYQPHLLGVDVATLRLQPGSE